MVYDLFIRERHWQQLSTDRSEAGFGKFFGKGKEMTMLKRVILLVGCAAAFMATNSHAVPPGLMREFEVKGMGNVVFSGRLHAQKGLACSECHPKIFKPQLGGNPITMDDITQGKFCGECHNGTRAFNAADSANCKKCHKK